MTWKNVLNEVFKLLKLIAFGKEWDEEGGCVLGGGRNKMKLTLYVFFLKFLQVRMCYLGNY